MAFPISGLPVGVVTETARTVEVGANEVAFNPLSLLSGGAGGLGGGLSLDAPSSADGRQSNVTNSPFNVGGGALTTSQSPRIDQGSSLPFSPVEGTNLLQLALVVGGAWFLAKALK